jgi:hypothetical protein
VTKQKISTQEKDWQVFIRRVLALSDSVVGRGRDVIEAKTGKRENRSKT